jgi:hypothetical protein
MVRYRVTLATCCIVGFLLGYLGADLVRHSDDPNPVVCSQIEAAITDPESAASRGPQTAQELEEAWDEAGCEEGQ